MMRNILIVEDDRLSMKLETEVLQAHDYDILQSVDGKDALVLATESSGDAVIRDMGNDASDNIKLIPPVFITETFHYVHEKNASIIPKLEKALQSIRDEGVWSDLLE